MQRRAANPDKHRMVPVAGLAVQLRYAAVAVLLLAVSATAQSQSVTQHHKQATRAGFYTFSSLANKSVPRTTRIPFMTTPLNGQVYAQLLYYTKAGKADVIIAATESNHIFAVYAGTGKVLYDRKLAPAMVSSRLPCGNIAPSYGITGTPIIDSATNSLYVAAMSTPDGGRTTTQLIWRMDIYTGKVAWVVDVAATLKNKFGITFTANVQNQRGALAIINNRLFVPYGGLAGDCGPYRGYVVSLALAATAPQVAGTMTYYRTSGARGGIWTPGGVSTDGTYAYVSTGNTLTGDYWQEGNAVLRLTSAPKFRNVTSDYFRPANWKDYDNRDIDLCGSHPVLFDYNGRKIVAQFGKDGIGYLIDRNNMKTAFFTRKLATGTLISAPAVYTGSDKQTYIVLKGNGLMCPGGRAGDMMAVRMQPTTPNPSFVVAWCASGVASGSPMATGATAGGVAAAVWSASTDNPSNSLRAFSGTTGALLFDSGALGAVARFHTPIMSKGRMYIAAGGRLHGWTIGG